MKDLLSCVSDSCYFQSLENSKLQDMTFLVRGFIEDILTCHCSQNCDAFDNKMYLFIPPCGPSNSCSCAVGEYFKANFLTNPPKEFYCLDSTVRWIFFSCNIFILLRSDLKSPLYNSPLKKEGIRPGHDQTFSLLDDFATVKSRLPKTDSCLTEKHYSDELL